MKGAPRQSNESVDPPSTIFPACVASVEIARMTLAEILVGVEVVVRLALTCTPSSKLDGDSGGIAVAEHSGSGYAQRKALFVAVPSSSD